MKSATRLLLLLLLCLSFTLAGCDSDDGPCTTCPTPYGDDIYGIWVAYNALLNGQRDEYGGTYGTAGIVIRVDEDDTGAMIDPTGASNLEFTWSRANDTLTIMSDEFGAQTADYVLDGNRLTTLVTESDGVFATYYQRYIGSDVLHGEWVLQSIHKSAEQTDPFSLYALEFRSNGSVVAHTDAPDPEVMPYSTDEFWLQIDGSQGMRFVFTVADDDLYLVDEFGTAWEFMRN